MIKGVNCRTFRLEFRLISKFGVGTWLKHVIKPNKNKGPKPQTLLNQKTRPDPPSLSTRRPLSLSRPSLSSAFPLLLPPPHASMEPPSPHRPTSHTPCSPISGLNPPLMAAGDQPVPRRSANRPWLGRFWRKDSRTLGRNCVCTVSFELLYSLKLNPHLESSLIMLKLLRNCELGFWVGLGRFTRIK